MLRALTICVLLAWFAAIVSTYKHLQLSTYFADEASNEMPAGLNMETSTVACKSLAGHSPCCSQHKQTFFNFRNKIAKHMNIFGEVDLLRILGVLCQL